MFVKPGPHPEKEGEVRRVMHPRTHAILSKDGEEVPASRWWIRHLNRGDVVDATPPVASASEPAAEHNHPA